MTYKQPVAWQVDDDDESYTIVFHTNGLAARRLGCEELDLDFTQANCRRAPLFDDCYPRATDIDKWDRGWWFECECGGRARKDDGGMATSDRYFCVECVSGFTEMKRVPTPKGLAKFFCQPLRYVHGRKHPDGWTWSGPEPYEPHADAYPLRADSFSDRRPGDWRSPYEWFDPFLAAVR